MTKPVTIVDVKTKSGLLLAIIAPSPLDVLTFIEAPHTSRFRLFSIHAPWLETAGGPRVFTMSYVDVGEIELISGEVRILPPLPTKETPVVIGLTQLWDRKAGGYVPLEVPA